MPQCNGRYWAPKMKDIGRTGSIHIIEEGILLSEKVTIVILPGFRGYGMITTGTFVMEVK